VGYVSADSSDSADILAKVKLLPLTQLDDLHDAALNFTKVSDLIAWLELNGQD
jgi:Domain of unknown function (DUF4351)